MIGQRDLGALAVTVAFRLLGTLLAPLLVVFGLFATVVTLSSGAAAAPVYRYDAQIHAYDGAPHSVAAHTREAAAVASLDASIGVQGRVANAAGPLYVLLSKSVAANSGADAMAGVRAAGQAGEDAAGILKNTQRIPSATGTAAYRIPDELGNGILGEVKNYGGQLSYTSQLQDFAAYAQANGLQFNLYVRGSTTFSGPLQEAIDAGVINRVPSLGP